MKRFILGIRWLSSWGAKAHAVAQAVIGIVNFKIHCRGLTRLLGNDLSLDPAGLVVFPFTRTLSDFEALRVSGFQLIPIKLSHHSAFIIHQLQSPSPLP